ncbi:MAG: hypothetical protein M1834_006138 [Cirrosporium novae-zelandiae]|nr:MAG: hypothetical protein M1834_006138 [Cirrosporium novae-zelandiae]
MDSASPIPSTPRPTTAHTTQDAVISIDNIDLEKGSSPYTPSSPDGSTTLADPDEPRSPKSITRQFTDRLKKISPSASFPISIKEKFTPAKYDENDENIQRIDFHPQGYPRLAAFINSDENFMMCRRFGFLHTRVLLYRQDELRELEDQLICLDQEDFEENPKLLQSRALDDAQEGSFRRGLIQTIDDKLKEYGLEDELVTRCREFATLKRTTNRNYNSLRDWMFNEKPLSEEESEFVNCDEDFIALAEPEEGGWFDGFIEDMLSKVPCKFTRLLFTSAAQRKKSADPYVHYYAKSRIDVLVRLFICVIAVALLMAPVAVLYIGELGNRDVLKIIVILLFTLIFCVALCVCTKAKRHEVFGATAA